MTPRLIISDIDGTFLTSAGRVTPRLRDVVMRAVRSGAHFGLATGRPHRWLMPVLDQLPISPVCVCANGAVTYDPARDEVLRAFELDSELMAQVVADVDAVFRPLGVRWGYGVERVGQSALDPEDEVFLVTPDYNPDAWDPRFGVAPVSELVSVPAAKLLVRCAEMHSAEMFDLIAPVIDTSEAHITYSMDEGLIEISSPGVTKATGVSALASHYGVSAEDVVAFGDMPNDCEMLAWSGLGVAMGNANPVVLDVADTVTVSNDEDGVAKVLEQWF
ncbi:Cof-type HAD-IIB family hydrolase [Corynebacterium sanguinis]|uniref:Cof-like hydrolase n=1 Tax=Corynebacterium lipophiloflavum (strain ATCC 700352 / DSM 44291 / CCUG 37336 / JCM 10383 / DMMZ 1944) TaxID=525263 RepID=C0XNN9_CORLD|nr:MULTISPECIES: Cof-type HAD-IIB family hydrolase [Corynebacterium]EEI18148.1 Cof-like hydrolase [Corynebacterium lipophiloflavum DSM 44291]MCT1585666.1 Cof-type HAD-IIB family hydrolase [Corynebacterium sanguinis]MCT1695952.1 Cof-type HAD-IIB family hydrolase [Corynebacterium sanguinis]MCT1715360.1 Cof-type HAD-IIB family hydrolase [Corynebacterium sanguinis]MCT1806154.1 Cof-type HAD-IIB family hydrolase [Corynebacterium sanguinis]